MDDNISTIHQFKTGDSFAEQGRFILETLLGVGGFADVYKARDTWSDLIIALKIYTTLNDDDILSLSKEYARMAHLNHPNILRADYFGSWGTVPYLMMQYCSGGSLDRQIGKLNEKEIESMVMDVAKGLEYLHAKHIVHQDIKPANILMDVTEEGTSVYKLSDFGISNKSKTQLSKSVRLAQAELSLTVGYAPPEKFSSIKSERVADPRGDIFSFGLSIYEVITGELPLGEISTGNQMYHYPNTEIDLSEIPYPRMRWIVDLCVQRARENRPDAKRIQEMLLANESTIPAKYFDNYSESQCNQPSPSNEESAKDIKPNIVNLTETIKSRSKKKIKLLYTSICVLSVLIGGILIFIFNGKDNNEAIVNDNNLSYIPDTNSMDILGSTVTMVKIPGGNMIYGADVSTDTTGMTSTSVKSFQLASTEVTQKLWEKVMRNNPSTVKSDNLPVNNVSWEDCQTFIKKLNEATGKKFRLPTEAEWEYAAKMQPGAEYSAFPGNNDDIAQLGWYKDNSGGNIKPVGQKEQNIFGLYDMGGNVIEWCEDTYSDYVSGKPLKGVNEKSLRGGYYDSSANAIRTISRGSADKKKSSPAFGLRLAMDAK